MFKKLVSLLVLLSYVLVTNCLFAQATATSAWAISPKPLPGEQDVGAAVSPMKKGQIAPFTGVLLAPLSVATIVAQLDSEKDKIKIEVNKAVSERDATCDAKTNEIVIKNDADKKVLTAQLDAKTKENAALSEVIKKMEGSKKDTTTWVSLAAGGGLVVGIVLTVAVVYAVKSASN